MTVPVYVHLAVEDGLSESMLRVLLAQANPRLQVGSVYGLSGNGELKANFGRYNEAARNVPFVVLTDLDQEACAPELIRKWLGNRPTLAPHMVFRVAVREVESWVMAHREAFARFLGIPVSKVPANVDALPDPKSFLLSLVKKSPKAALKKAMLPKPGWRGPIGPGYNSELATFLQQHWKACEAIRHSDSLQRAWNNLSGFGTPKSKRSR